MGTHGFEEPGDVQDIRHSLRARRSFLRSRRRAVEGTTAGLAPAVALSDAVN
jgi:hypothetical protein